MDSQNRKKLLLVIGVVATIVIGLILIISFIGRGRSNNTNPNQPNQPSNPGNSQQITLEYWGLWEPEGVMQPLIEKYEANNPHVKIVYTQRSFNQYETTIFTRLEQGLSSDTPAPDILRVSNAWLNKLQQYLYPISSGVMSNSEYAQTFHPTAVSDFTGTDGQIYAIPLEIDGLALFYNKEIFAKANVSEPPADWDSVIELAKQLTVKGSSGEIEQAGLGMGSSTNVFHSADIFSLLLLQNGVEINQNNNTAVDLRSTRAADAMEFYVSFVRDHEVWSPDLRSDLEMFYQGNLAMMLAPSWRAFDIINSNPSIEFGIAPAPVLPGEPVYYSMYWGEAVSRTSQNPDEAWKFVKYLSQQEQLREFHNNSIKVAGRAFGEPYSRVDMSSEMQHHAYLGAFMKMAPNMKAWKMGEQSYIEEQFRTAINDVVVNGTTSQTALLQAEESINQKLSSSIQ